MEDVEAPYWVAAEPSVKGIGDSPRRTEALRGTGRLLTRRVQSEITIWA